MKNSSIEIKKIRVWNYLRKYSISFLEVDENIKCISKDNFYYDTDLFGEKIKKPIYTFGVNF